MSARKALGKGLGALIPGAEEGAKSAASGSDRIGIEQIAPSRYQPRLTFEDEPLELLAESIRVQGIIEPVVVRTTPEGSETPYELVVGERRWRAAQKVGLDTVPAIVREMTDAEALEMAIAENLQREDLNPIEEARAYRMLIDEFEMTQEKTASRIGIERSTVTNALRLLKLEPDIQEDIMWGRLTAGHARALLQVDGNVRKKLHKDIVGRCLSVREAESIARKLSSTETKKVSGKSAERTEATIAAAVKDLQERLGSELGSKVKIKIGKRGGTVEIKFSNTEQLEGICHRIME